MPSEKRQDLSHLCRANAVCLEVVPNHKWWIVGSGALNTHMPAIFQRLLPFEGVFWAPFVAVVACGAGDAARKHNLFQSVDWKWEKRWRRSLVVS